MPTKEEKNMFSDAVLHLMNEYGVDPIDAVITYCEQNNIEMEIAGSLVNETLKSHLAEQYSELNYLDREEKLPL